MKRKKHLEAIQRTITLPSTNRTVGKRCHSGERTEYFPVGDWRDFMSTLTQEDVLFYPNDQKLKTDIAAYHGVQPENIMVFAGADQALKCIVDTFVDPGSTVLTPEYHFPMYDVYTAQNAGKLALIKYKGLSLSTIAEGSIEDIRLVIIGNPNSPVGDSPSEAYLTSLEQFDCPIVVDSVYSAFGCTRLDVIEKIRKNYIFVHSFSKSWGAPGIRCGYLIATESMINLLTAMKPMVPVSGFSLKFAEWALQNMIVSAAYVNRIVQIRDDIASYYPWNIGGSWVHLPESKFAQPLTMSGFTFKPGCKLPGKAISLIRVTISKDLLDHI
jgi:histidinol-phosphate/aromatic aminotransferase/cobyric acid decarboxylase-like protein